MINHPITFHPTLRGSGVRILESMQGQDLIVVVDGRDDGNAPGAPMSQLAVVMEPGKVSTPHVHDDAHVFIRLEEAGPQGVLTLYGDRLDSEEWLFPGGTLWIPPGVPHVAVYPRFSDVETPTAVAIETRSIPDPLADVRALPKLWSTLVDNLVDLELTGHLDAPAAVGGTWDRH